jgi:hypothetical protein
MTPTDLFQKVMADNNLTATWSKPQIRFIENGGVIVEQPQLLVTFTTPPKPVDSQIPADKSA